MQRARLLMIPSWYSNRVNTNVVGFFTDPAVLLQQRYDVRVLFGYSPYLEHKSLYGKYHRYVTRERGKIWPNNFQDPLPTIRFDYGHWWMGERLLLDAALDGYRKMLKRIISDGWKPDILHAQCVELAGIITARLSEEFNIPWVLTEHQRFGLGNYSEYRQKLIRNALKTPKTIAVVSQHLLRCIAIHNIDRPMVVVGNLIDEDVFQFSPPQKESKSFRILTVQWPHMIKDPETFFHAISIMIQNGHKDLDVTVIGKKLLSDANVEEFQHLAEKYHVQEVCSLVPNVPHKEMHQYYVGSDVFVSTSVEETFGVAVREAMAVGRPVVCTASGGVDDDIFDFNGIKVDIHDFAGVAAALISIKTGAVQYDPVRIRDFVVSKYSRQAFINKMSAIFDDAISSK